MTAILSLTAVRCLLRVGTRVQLRDRQIHSLTGKIDAVETAAGGQSGAWVVWECEPRTRARLGAFYLLDELLEVRGA